LVAIDAISSALAKLSSNEDNGGEKLCTALEEGAAVVKELESTFSARWTIESRFPTATKKICCIGTATQNCVSRLQVEVGKLSARVHAVNGLMVEEEREAASPTGQANSSEHNGYNPFDDGSEESTGTENAATAEEAASCSIGVDTTDLVRSSSDAPEKSHNNLSTPECSSEGDRSLQFTVEFLKSRVNELEAERENHMVDLSLLRRKLENLGAKETGDSAQTEIEMLKEVNRERLRTVTDNLQIAQCAMNYYKGECEILLRKYFLCMEEKRVLEETVREMRRELSALTDELASVRRGYDNQLSQMTEHVAELNGKLAGFERERSEQKAPPTPQRSG
ncbi:hypothetical protein OESDEN_25289, partial [Oesophagostomum dentatum]